MGIDLMLGLLAEIWNLTVRMAPYLLFGFLIAGLLHVLLPDEVVYRHLSGKNILSVIKAALFGVPLPLCSCGVIPVAAHLRRQGASSGATVSFLTSTPTTGVDSILATYSLLGIVFAVARPIAAFVAGITVGIVANLIDKSGVGLRKLESGEICETCGAPSGHGDNLISKLKIAISYGFGELVEDISKWLAIGIIAGGILSFFVPKNFFADYLGNPLLAYLVVLAIATPMYVCATGSIPIAAALVAKGMTPGAALVFLIAGPATNTATLSFVGGKLGRKMLVAYLFVILLVAFAFGFTLDSFFRVEAIRGVLSAKSGFLPTWLSTLSAVLLTLLVFRSFLKKYFLKKPKEVKGMGVVLKVPDMSCNHCVMTIKNALSAIDGVKEVRIDLESKLVEVEGDVPFEEIKEAILKAGYTPEMPVEM